MGQGRESLVHIAYARSLPINAHIDAIGRNRGLNFLGLILRLHPYFVSATSTKFSCAGQYIVGMYAIYQGSKICHTDASAIDEANSNKITIKTKLKPQPPFRNHTTTFVHLRLKNTRFNFKQVVARVDSYNKGW